MRFDCIPRTTTDTGAMMIDFLYKNPEYKLKYLQFTTGAEWIKDLYNFEFYNNNKYIHFGTSTLWNNNKKDYKIRILKFIELVKNGLTDKQEEQIKEEYKKNINKKHNYCNNFMKNICTYNDLKKFII